MFASASTTHHHERPHDDDDDDDDDDHDHDDDDDDDDDDDLVRALRKHTSTEEVSTSEWIGMSSIARIKKELEALWEEPLPCCAAGPVTGDDLYHWQAVVLGPEGTPYSGGIFFLNIQFPVNYPACPPTFQFETPIFHYNVQNDGRVFFAGLQDQWSPVLSIGNILSSIRLLMMHCENLHTAREKNVKIGKAIADSNCCGGQYRSSSRLEMSSSGNAVGENRVETKQAQLRQLFQTNRSEYNRQAREWTLKHAT